MRLLCLLYVNILYTSAFWVSSVFCVFCVCCVVCVFVLNVNYVTYVCVCWVTKGRRRAGIWVFCVFFACFVFVSSDVHVCVCVCMLLCVCMCVANVCLDVCAWS